MVDGEEEDDIEELTYQAVIVDKEGRGSKDIVHHKQKVSGAFQTLRRVWAARGINRMESQDTSIQDLRSNGPTNMAVKLGRSPRMMKAS